MRLAVEVARRGFRRYSTYRGATVAALFTNVVWGILLSSVVSAVIRNRGGDAVDGYGEAALITQVWVGQGLLGVVDVFNRSNDLTERIRSGDVVVDLYRPVDLHLWWASIDAGRALYEVLVRFVPPVVIGLAFGARLPRPADVPLVLVALVLAAAVSFGIRFLASAAGFWVLDARGIARGVMVLWLVAGGMTIPLPLLPDGVEAVFRLLPFAATVQVVADVWVGRPQPGAPTALVAQAGWAVLLAVAARLVIARATRRVVIQGG